MGYTTTFVGSFSLDKTLHPVHLAYLKRFSETRRVKRNADKASKLPDDVRISAELPIGPEGAYFVGSENQFGDDNDDSIVDHNSPPKEQPCLWCQWIPSEDGNSIVWNGGEKFYDYEDWIEYICSNFLQRWGYTLNGRVEWQGECEDDKGVLTIVDNVLTVED